MNTRSIITLLALSTLSPQLSSAQGSLTPPAGPPVASMKTLDQVEARTPLVAGQPGVAVSAAGTITISLPGSYYLTRNLTITTAAAKGVVISSNGVTLDLNGFSLICTAVSGGDAISGGGTGLHIRNGTILGGSTVTGNVFTLAGWDSGVNVSGALARVSDVSVTGVRFHGVFAGYDGSVVERVRVSVCGRFGIVATNVMDSQVKAAGWHGIVADTALGNGSGAVVNNSSAESLGIAGSADVYGIEAFGGLVSNSQGYSRTWHGLAAETATNCRGESVEGMGLIAITASNCSGKSTNNTGLSCTGVAMNCTGTSTGDVGLQSVNATNCIGSSTSGSAGLSVSGTASYCRGTRTSGTAIGAVIAIGCTSGGGTISATNKYLMP